MKCRRSYIIDVIYHFFEGQHFSQGQHLCVFYENLIISLLISVNFAFIHYSSPVFPRRHGVATGKTCLHFCIHNTTLSVIQECPTKNARSVANGELCAEYGFSQLYADARQISWEVESTVRV